MRQPDFTIIRDLEELRTFIASTRAFSISAPLQVGSEFMMAVYYGGEEVSECACLHVPR